MSVPASSQAGPETERQFATSTWPRRRAHQRSGISSSASTSHPSAAATGNASSRASNCHSGIPANSMFDQNLWKPAFDLARLDLIVEFRDFG